MEGGGGRGYGWEWGGREGGKKRRRRGGSTVVTFCIWPDNSGSELDAALLSWFPAWSVCLDEAVPRWWCCGWLGANRGGLVVVLRSHVQYRMFTHTALTQPPPSKSSEEERRRDESSQSYITHSSAVYRHGFLLFGHSFFFFFQHRKLRKTNCRSDRLNWSVWIVIRQGFSFSFPISWSRVKGSSSIPRPLLRSSSKGLEYQTCNPAFLFFFFFFIFFFFQQHLGPCAASLTMFCSCMVPVTVYLCRCECGNVRQSEDAVMVWFLLRFFLSCGRHGD